MTLTSFSLDTVDIRLSRTLVTGAGSLGDRSGLRLSLTSDDATGVGETAPIPGVPSRSLDELALELRTWAEGAIGKSAEELLDQLDSSQLDPLARFAVHTALADLVCRQLDVPMHTWLRATSDPLVRTNALVTSESPGSVHADVSTAVNNGAIAVKLKVGAADTGIDVTRIIAASEAAGASVELRLDANGSWSRADVERVIGRVGRHRISYIEDPTSDRSEFGSLERELGVAIAIDARPDDSTDLVGMIERNKVSVLVVKAAAVGGVDRILDAARALPDSARLVVTSAIDGPIGLLAGLHAAAALPDSITAHGLGTGELVRGIPDWLIPRAGQIHLAAGVAGLGDVGSLLGD